MAEIPKNPTWGRQDLYPYRNKEDRLQQIDDLREVIHTAWLRDKAKDRREELRYGVELLRGARIAWNNGRCTLTKFFEPKKTEPYPNDSKEQCKKLRDLIHTRWLEDQAEERRRELVLMVSLYRLPTDSTLGTPDKYFDEWMEINDFFLEEMANHPNNLRMKQEQAKIDIEALINGKKIEGFETVKVRGSPAVYQCKQCKREMEEHRTTDHWYVCRSRQEALVKSQS